MIGLDTNILVRYLVQDHKEQSALAAKLIEGLSSHSPGFITCIALCELNWVLKSCYKVSKTERLSILDKILSIPVFEVEHYNCCLKALHSYKEGGADYSDYLIAQIALQEGCSAVATFDKKAAEDKIFELLVE